MKHPLQHVGSHLTSNLVGYLALFVALGGTSYAALSLPNHSIDPVNLNPRYIGGYVRAWASVDANGRVLASSGAVRVVRGSEPGFNIVTWNTHATSPCEASGSVDSSGVSGTSIPGYLLTASAGTRGRGEQTDVDTYDAQGQSQALPFDVELVCGTPRSRR